MVKHCISSRYSRTRCYDIPERDKNVIKNAINCIVIIIIITCIIYLCNRNKESGRKNKILNILLVLVFGLTFFLIFYQQYTIRGLKPIS